MIWWAAAFGTSLVFGLLAGPGGAGDYHLGETLICVECHKNGTRVSRHEGNAACLTCHGSGPTGTPGVLAANGSGVVRQAGALNGTGGAPGHAMGHTLGSPDRAPGGTWMPGAGGMTCTDCHAAHGVPGQYRNLLLRPGTAETDRKLTYGSGPTNDLTKDVWVRPAPTKAARYAAENVRFNQPDPTQSAYAAWCQGCHMQFHGPPGSPNMGGALGGANGRAWVRHPTTGVPLGAGGDRHSSFARYASLSNRVPTMSASGTWPARDNAVACMSCHKAHGNRNPFGLLYMSGRGQVTEEGDTGGRSYVHLCQQCHMQGLQ